MQVGMSAYYPTITNCFSLTPRDYSRDSLGSLGLGLDNKGNKKQKKLPAYNLF